MIHKPGYVDVSLKLIKLENNMLTQREFIKRYCDYATQSETLAKDEAAKANQTGVESDSAVAVEFRGAGWKILLKSVFDDLVEFGYLNEKAVKEKEDMNYTTFFWVLEGMARNLESNC